MHVSVMVGNGNCDDSQRLRSSAEPVHRLDAFVARDVDEHEVRPKREHLIERRALRRSRVDDCDPLGSGEEELEPFAVEADRRQDANANRVGWSRLGLRHGESAMQRDMLARHRRGQRLGRPGEKRNAEEF